MSHGVKVSATNLLFADSLERARQKGVEAGIAQEYERVRKLIEEWVARLESDKAWATTSERLFAKACFESCLAALAGDGEVK